MKWIQMTVAIALLHLLVQLPTVYACKVMGEPSRNQTAPEQICRKECSFFDGFSGRADNHLKAAAFPYVDCHCNAEPKDGLCQ